MGKLTWRSEFRKRLAAVRPRLVRAALVWTRNRELAEDLVQETISKGLRKAKQLRRIEALEAWLFRIMMNNWRDQIRRNPVTEDIDNHEISTHHTPESENSRKETMRGQDKTDPGGDHGRLRRDGTAAPPASGLDLHLYLSPGGRDTAAHTTKCLLHLRSHVYNFAMLDKYTAQSPCMH